MARHWRIIAQQYQRQMQAMLFELGRVAVRYPDLDVSLNPPQRVSAVETPDGLVVTSTRLEAAPELESGAQLELRPCGSCGRLVERLTRLNGERRYCGPACRTRAWRARSKLRG